MLPPPDADEAVRSEKNGIGWPRDEGTIRRKRRKGWRRDRRRRSRVRWSVCEEGWRLRNGLSKRWWRKEEEVVDGDEMLRVWRKMLGEVR